jgi:hypothetical protein
MLICKLFSYKGSEIREIRIPLACIYDSRDIRHTYAEVWLEISWKAGIWKANKKCKDSLRYYLKIYAGSIYAWMDQEPRSWPMVFFFNLVCEAIGTAATPGLLCQPRVIVKMIVEKQMECRLAGETEVLLGENLPQRYCCPSQNPTWPDPGLNPGRRGGKPASNRLSYDAAWLHLSDLL